jgi:hypothetical protein
VPSIVFFLNLTFAFFKDAKFSGEDIGYHST